MRDNMKVYKFYVPISDVSAWWMQKQHAKKGEKKKKKS